MKDFIDAAERMAWPKKKKLINDELVWTMLCLGIFVLFVYLTN